MTIRSRLPRVRLDTYLPSLPRLGGTRILRDRVVVVANNPEPDMSTISFGDTGLTPSTSTEGDVIVDGTVNAASGGTGASSLAIHGVVIGQGASTVHVTSPGTAGQVLTSGGINADPAFADPAPITSTTVAHGGTGVTALSAHGVVVGEGTSAVNVTAPGTAGQVLTSAGASADPVMADIPNATVAKGGTGATSLSAHGVVLGQGTSAVSVTAPGTTGQVLTSAGPSADPVMASIPVQSPDVPHGGTGVITIAAHALVVGNGASAINTVAPSTAGKVLTANGVSADPTFQDLPNATVAKGGTGATTLAAHGVVLGQGTSAVAVTSAGTAGQVLTSNGASADPTFQPSAGGGITVTGGNMIRPTTIAQVQTAIQAAVDNGRAVFFDGSVPAINFNATMTINLHGQNWSIFGGGLNLNWTGTDGSTPAVVFQNDGADYCVDWTISDFNLFGNAFASSGCGRGFSFTANNGQDMFQGSIQNMFAQFCGGDGFYVAGRIFECWLPNWMAKDNNGHGVTFETTFGGGGGVISNIMMTASNFSRSGGYGVNLVAETRSIDIVEGSFIVNALGGVNAPTGIRGLYACDFENSGLTAINMPATRDPCYIVGCHADSQGFQTHGSGVPARYLLKAPSGFSVATSVGPSNAAYGACGTGGLLVMRDCWIAPYDGGSGAPTNMALLAP